MPRVRLTELPTPLQRASRLEEALRDEGMRPPRIYIKRDDLLGLALGGNKIRNLEFSLGAAIADGATDVVTVGRAQSNHCRLTAAACARLGLRAHLVMSGDRPRVSTGNLLLSEMFGASIEFTGTEDRAAREGAAERIAEAVRTAGGRPFMLPVGGSDARGAIGHALAAMEIVAECAAIGADPRTLVLATATGGTQAGLLLGLAALGSTIVVRGFSVHKRASEARDDVARILHDAAEMIGMNVERAVIEIDDSQLGDGYGVPSRAGDDAIAMLARTEGLVLDQVYTGKATAGLLAMVRTSRLQEAGDVVFVHTGGTPAVFADLPATSM
jgi:D-cysteine desulfhydrase family pyridoxal phosphate-dependent enzyme